VRYTTKHRNTLQHTADNRGSINWSLCPHAIRKALCNTLQNVATHSDCKTLLRAATHCDTLPTPQNLCNTLQHSVTLCNTLQPSAPHYNTVTLHHTAVTPKHVPNKSKPRGSTRRGSGTLQQHTVTHSNIALCEGLSTWLKTTGDIEGDVEFRSRALSILPFRIAATSYYVITPIPWHAIG